MVYAIISDIHSNSDALTKVLEDIGDRNIEEILCLGDVVGYGPEPRRCLETISKVCSVVVKGNHDEAVLTAPFGFNPYARNAIEWSKFELDPAQNNGNPDVSALWMYLENLPISHKKEEIPTLFVHASPRDPITEYVLEKDVKSPPGGKLDQIFDAFEKLAFVGHSHVPGIFMENRKYITPISGEPFRLPKEGKCLINVGSVGQPRDYDNRACWVEVNGDLITHYRVPYNFHKTNEKVLATGRLHVSLGARLKIGV